MEVLTRAMLGMGSVFSAFFGEGFGMIVVGLQLYKDRQRQPMGLTADRVVGTTLEMSR